MQNNFSVLKNDILGKDYALSIAFVNEKKSREINKKYRKKDSATNVLSFALRKGEGELVLCKPVIKREALGHIPVNKPGETKNFNRTYQKCLNFLVIHGMLHLKGLKHSSTMERAEKFYCKKYNKQYDQKYYGRHRLGILDDEGHRGRVHQGRKKS